ncbi:MAG: hypothetical protein AABZ47_14195 [Planctomycetota bacterium]
MSTEELFKRLESHVDKIAAATVAILGIQNERIVHDRTGVLYQIGGESFILTASHDLQGIVKSKIPHFVLVNKDGVLPIPLTAPAGVHGTEVDGRDIACISLPDNLAIEIAKHKRFISHDEVRIHDEQPGRYVIVGFPAKWSVQKLGDDYLYSHPLVYLCTPFAGQPDSDSAYRREVHILLSIEQDAHELTSKEVENLPDFHGISGCGVWRIPDKLISGSSTSCAEKPTLVAIQNKWHKGLKYIMATRIKWVLDRILDDYPTLNRPMRLIYPTKVQSRIVVPEWVTSR